MKEVEVKVKDGGPESSRWWVNGRMLYENEGEANRTMDVHSNKPFRTTMRNRQWENEHQASETDNNRYETFTLRGF